MGDSIRNQTFLTERGRERRSLLPQSPGSPEPTPIIPHIQPDIMFPSRPHTSTLLHDTFDVKLPGQEDTSVRVSCPKPSQLKTLLAELHTNGDTPESKCKIEYRDSDSGERIKIVTQQELDAYMKLENRQQLFLSST